MILVVILGIVGALGAALVPVFADNGVLFLLIELFVIIALAQSWNLLAGFGGLMSLGHHAFLGVGAYTLFVASKYIQINPYYMLPLAPLAAGILALLLAPVLFRLRDVYFAIAMWVVAEIVRILVSRTDILGGSGGLPFYGARLVDRSMIVPMIYGMSATLAIGLTVGFIWLLRTPFGLGLFALRDDPTAARSIGISVQRTRLIIFVISAMGTGLAGTLSFMSSMFVSPIAAFDLKWVVTLVFVVIIGGIGTIEGPIIGAIIYILLRETLASQSGVYLIILGAVAIAVMIFAPSGIAGLIRKRFSWRGLERAHSVARS